MRLGLDAPSQPVRNYASNPRVTAFSAGAGQTLVVWNDRWTAFTSYSIVSGAVDGPTLPSGSQIATYARATVTNARTGLGFHLPANLDVAGPPAVPYTLPVTPGEKVTISFFFRCSVASNWGIGVRASQSGAWLGGTAGTGYLPLSAGVWTRMSHTHTVPANATHLNWYAISNTLLSAGVTFDITGYMITKTPTLTPYTDGAANGGRWLGSANASESVGYPLSA